MHITPIKVHGRKRWRLDLRSIKKGCRTFMTKSGAETELETLANQQKYSGEIWLTLSPQERNALISVHSEMSKEGVTIQEAWDFFRKHRGKQFVSRTLDAAIKETVDAKRLSGRREIYVRGLENYLKAFARGREQIDIAQIGPADVEKWFSERNEAPQSRNSNLGRLSTLFQFCWRRNYIRENPCRRVDRASVEIDAPFILTPDQCRATVDWVISHKPDLLAWIVLTLFIGLRPLSEADLVAWSVIDLYNRRIRLEGSRTKTRSHRIIDLNQIPGSWSWLMFAKKLNCPLPIRYMTRRRALRGLRDHLGLKRWPPDVLRHTAASYLFAHHQDAGKVAAILGNSAAVLLQRYRALVVKEDAAKFFAIRPTPAPL